MKTPWFSFGTHESPEIVEECRVAEESGFDGVLFPEHHGVAGWSANPLLVAYKVGIATTSIQVGSAPILLPLYEPVRLAETAAFIQNELNGRLIVGVGGGYMPEDFAHFGRKLAERGSRQNEGIDIMRLAWSGKPFQYEGRRYSVASQGCLPVPNDVPPIWVCSGAEAGVRRAAKLGDALVLDGMRTREELLHFISIYNGDLTTYGKTGEVVLTKRIWIGVANAANEMLNQAIGQYTDDVVAGSDAPWLALSPDRENGKIKNDRLIAGPQDTVLAGLIEWIETMKPDRVILKLPFISEQPSSEVIVDQLRKIGSVLSSLRSS